MQDLTEKNLLKQVDETVEWASDLGDQWVGTLIGRILDSERDNLLYMIKEGNLELASVSVLNLAMTCQHAEQKLKEAEELSV